MNDPAPGFPRAATSPLALRGRSVLLDASLSLINRTGAHYIAEKLCDAFGEHEQVVVRRWRVLGKRRPPPLLRRVLGRLMLKELERFAAAPWLLWPEPRVAGALTRVFLDPLYVLRSKLTKSDIVLSHDVGPLTHPQLYDEGTIRLYRAAYARIRETAPGMVFVSNASRRAFEALFGRHFRFMQVISPLVRADTARGEVEPVPGIEPPFLLTVGALEVRKNQATAVRAFAESRLHDRGFSYVLCGPAGAGAEAVHAAVEATAGARVLGYVSDGQLRWLYQNATAFVLPSLLEGFGMPALEAALHGLIPILSRDSALSEAVDSLGIAVDPLSTSELSAAMCRVADLGAAEAASWRQRLVAHARQATPERFVEAWRTLLQSES